MKRLEDQPCYAVDLYSLGSEGRNEYATPHGLAKAVFHMLKVEKLNKINLMGNSVGGIVSQIIASKEPDLVRRLILIGTGANTNGALPDFAAAVDQWATTINRGDVPSREDIEKTVDLLFSYRPEGEEWETYIHAVIEAEPYFMSSVLQAARQLDLIPELHKISAPTLVIRGTEDRARSAEHSEALVSGIRTAESVELHGGGHSPMVDLPREFLPLISRHLNT